MLLNYFVSLIVVFEVGIAFEVINNDVMMTDDGVEMPIYIKTETDAMVILVL